MNFSNYEIQKITQTNRRSRIPSDSVRLKFKKRNKGKNVSIIMIKKSDDDYLRIYKKTSKFIIYVKRFSGLPNTPVRKKGIQVRKDSREFPSIFEKNRKTKNRKFQGIFGAVRARAVV